VWLVQRAGAPEPVIAASAVAVFLGHLFPLFLRFRGGKGVATSLGAWLALDPVLGVAALGVWALTATLTRLSSAAALVAAIVAPVVCWWRHGAEPLTFAVIIMAALLMLRHKANIRNLLARSETKIGSRRDASL
jgi:glycerol-3-phosphate acyltransferase PlsY